MYTTVRGVPTAPADATAGTPASGRAPAGATAARGVGRRRVSRVVIVLGTVSLFTDLSSEMVSAILPVYLTLVLGLSPLQYGVVDGIYQGVTAAVRIAGGLGADLTRRPKLVAVLGYGLSCVCKLFFLPAHTFAAIGAVVAVDRSGKGLRTAPRDAMIADASEPSSLGYSFGVHRAMDTVGALGGPLIAVGILALLANAYDAIFVLSFSLAAIGVAVLVLFVPNKRRGDGPATGPADQAWQPAGRQARQAAGQPAEARAAGPSGRARLAQAVREVGGLVRLGGYRRTMGVAALLSVTTIGDGFVYLVLKDRAGVSASIFPLLFVGTSIVYLGLAIPLGRLADRVGRAKVFIGGHVAAAAGYLALWWLPGGAGLVVAVLALVGTYYAATDGVLPALTVPLVPESVRGSGIAGVQTVMAAGNLLSAVLFGTLWATFGPHAAVGTFALLLLAVAGLAAWLIADVERRGAAGTTGGAVGGDTAGSGKVGG